MARNTQAACRAFAVSRVFSNRAFPNEMTLSFALPSSVIERAGKVQFPGVSSLQFRTLQI
jgi:hypothetical protein